MKYLSFLLHEVDRENATEPQSFSLIKASLLAHQAQLFYIIEVLLSFRSQAFDYFFSWAELYPPQIHMLKF